VQRFLDSIRAQGLLRGARHHVHLSATTDTATGVGQRRGRPVILHVQATAMARAGYEFFRSANDVWLTDHVPVASLVFPSDDG
jgi:putative RNA 2'-phosphotransferase